MVRSLNRGCQFGLSFFLTVWISAAICQSAPLPLAPPDDARFGIEDGIVIFEWQDDLHADFEIEIGIDEAFDVGTGPLPVEAATFYNLSDLIPDDVWMPLTLTIFWRVRAVTSLNAPGAWSEIFKLHKTTLSVPVILAGSDGRYNHLGDMPLLEWENPDEASRFSVEFALDPLFEQVLGRVNVTGSILDFEGTDRTTWDAIEGMFYWHVAALSDSLVPGPWSDEGRISKTRIIAPVVTGPEDGTVYAPRSDPAVLEWETLNTIDRYQIRLCADAECAIEIITLDHTGLPVFDFSADLGISEETWWYAPFTLYWAIAGFDDAGRPGPFSEPREMIKPGYHRVAAYGDSITDGKCVEHGYLDDLHNRLTSVWGSRTSTVNIAVPGMKSKWGAQNLESRLKGSCPQYVLIMFGTNDAVDPGNCDPPFECDVAGHLAEMVTTARNRGSIPIIATIIPVNPEGNLAGAQDDIDYINDDIIQMATQMGVDLVDLNALFWAYGDLPELFCDWGHPNEVGYEIMATGFFNGIMTADPG